MHTCSCFANCFVSFASLIFAKQAKWKVLRYGKRMKHFATHILHEGSISWNFSKALCPFYALCPLYDLCYPLPSMALCPHYGLLSSTRPSVSSTSFVSSTALCLLYGPLSPLRPYASSTPSVPLHPVRPSVPFTAFCHPLGGPLCLLYSPLCPSRPSVLSTALCLLYIALCLLHGPLCSLQLSVFCTTLRPLCEPRSPRWT